MPGATRAWPCNTLCPLTRQGRPLEVREGLGQCPFLVWSGMTRGFPTPSTAGTLPTRGGGAGAGEEPPAGLGHDAEPGQADLSQGNSSLTSRPSAWPAPPAQCGAGPEGGQPAPWGCPTPGGRGEVTAFCTCSVSSRARSPDPISTGREGTHLEPHNSRVPYPTTASCSQSHSQTPAAPAGRAWVPPAPLAL